MHSFSTLFRYWSFQYSKPIKHVRFVPVTEMHGRVADIFEVFSCFVKVDLLPSICQVPENSAALEIFAVHLKRIHDPTVRVKLI